MKNSGREDKTANVMYIRIMPTTPVLPLTPNEYPDDQHESEVLAQCPRIDLRTVNHQEEITEFLIRLFAYYFDIPASFIHPQSRIVDDIERYVWAKELGVDIENVTYGHIFCDKDSDGRVIGGIEDRGMMIAMMYLTDFSDLIGIEEVDLASIATFEADRDKFGCYYECNTIAELSTLLYSVCKEAQNVLLRKGCISSISRKLKNHSVGAITAFSPGYSPKENSQRNQHLLAKLMYLGYQAIELNDYFIKNSCLSDDSKVSKSCYFVVNPKKGNDQGKLKTDLIELGKEYEQSMVLSKAFDHDAEIIFTNDDKNTGSFHLSNVDSFIRKNENHLYIFSDATTIMGKWFASSVMKKHWSEVNVGGGL